MSAAEPLVEIRDVRFTYEGAATPALDGVSLELRSGEFVGMIGQNGSGKTTLARHLNGLLRPDTGYVRVKGAAIRETEPGKLATTVGYVFQNPDHALFLPSVRQEIEYGLGFLGLNPQEIRIRGDAALSRFGLLEMADRHPASFGRGTRRLVVLAAADALHPDLLVLDEPTGGLDRLLTVRLMARLVEIVAEGRSVLLISHDMQVIADHCTRVIALHAGRVAADGTAREIFGQSELLARIGITRPQIGQLARQLARHGLDPDIVATAELGGALIPRVRAAEREVKSER